LFFGGKHISYLIQTQQGDFRIIVDEGVDIPGFGQFGREVKESNKYGLIASEDGLMAKRGGDMVLAPLRPYLSACAYPHADR